jgi:hypothetical protein
MVLVAIQRDLPLGAASQGHRGLPFGSTGGWCEVRVHDQSMPILHLHMVNEAELVLRSPDDLAFG